MPLSFNSQPMIPSPLVTESDEILRFPNGLIKRVGYVLTLRGTIVNIDTILDSPAASGYIGLDGILAEQQRIRGMFNVESGVLTITSPTSPSYSPLNISCRPDSVTFGDGVWVNRCDYTVVLKADALGDDANSFSQTEGLEDIGENWQVKENEDATYEITHNINAKGALIYKSGSYNDPLSVAKGWVYNKSVNLDNSGNFTYNTPASGSLDFSKLLYSLPATTNYFNKSTVEIVDPVSYSYSLNESFLFCPSGNYRENFTVVSTYDETNIGRAKVVINGRVEGLAGDTKNYVTKFSNANNRFVNFIEPNLWLRASNYSPSGFVLSPTVDGKTVTRSPYGGLVEYSVGFLATSGGTLIPNAIEESVEVTDTGPTNIVASIPIFGRANGPLLQNMRTSTAITRSINISAKILPSGYPSNTSLLTSFYLSKPQTSNIISALKPSNAYFYLTQDQENWNIITRNYTRTVSWLIDNFGSGISGQQSGVYNLNPNS